jgi:hypothetical protein
MKKPLINTTIQNEEFRIAILNNDLDCFENLCRKESRSSQIREYDYIHRRALSYDQSFCYIGVVYRVSVEQFKFILKVSKERPSQYVFNLAVDYCLWDIVSYLHNYDFKHGTVERVFSHLFDEKRRDAIEIALYYPNLWDALLEYSDQIADIIDVARHRRNRAFDATIAILSLKKKRPNLIHKDVLQIIAKMIIQKDNVAKKEWGEPRFFDRSSLIARNDAEWVSVFVVLCILFFVIYYFLILIF